MPFDPYRSQDAQIQQRLKFAQMLRENALTPDQGQMVSGHYIKPSLTQGLSRLLQSGLGSKEMEGALSDQKSSDSQRQSALSEALAGYSKGGDPNALLSNPDTMQYGMQAIGERQKADYTARLKGPVTRDFKQGDQTVTQQYDPTKQAWSELGRGDSFAPKSGPQTIEVYKAVHPEDTAMTGFDAWQRENKKAGSSGAQPYFQFLPGADGYLVGNARSGEITPGMVNGQKAVPGALDPTLQGNLATAKTAGKETGVATASLADIESHLPRLEQVTKELSGLGKKATYTMVGQGVNALRRQTGMEATEGAKARAEYIAKIDNEVLPLLRQTFGAQFTEKEGTSLKNTLGDPNKSPEEKDAVLTAFIEGKRAQIGTTQRRVNPAATPSFNSRGWGLHQDAQGNKAYLGPHGEVEEVQ